MGQILFSAVECVGDYCEPFDGDVAPIYLINSDGSGMRQIYEGIGVIGDLHLSPDGTRLTFTDSYGRGVSNVYVLDLISGHAWSLMPDDTSQKVWGPRWVSSDKLVFTKIDGMNSPTFQSNLYLASVDGTQLQQLTDRPPRTRIHNVSVSPDGTQLLFAEFLLDSNVTTVYCMNIDGTGLRELMTFPGMRAASVAWSPAGDRIVIHPDPLGFADYAPVYVARSDSSEVTEIATLPGTPSLLAWTEDQTGLIFYVCSVPLEVNQIVEVQSDGDTRTLATIELPTTPSGATPCSFGSLSPGWKKFTFSQYLRPGLYVTDVPSDCGYQILSGYRVQSLLWLPEDVVLQPVHQ